MGVLGWGQVHARRKCGAGCAPATLRPTTASYKWAREAESTRWHHWSSLQARQARLLHISAGVQETSINHLPAKSSSSFSSSSSSLLLPPPPAPAASASAGLTSAGPSCKHGGHQVLSQKQFV